jgi:Zn-dependent protease
VFSSWNIGRLFGIDIKVHSTFVILLVFAAAQGWFSQHSFDAGVHEMVKMIVLFAIVVLHELGHALTARAFGVRTRDITLYPIGGAARLESMPPRPWQELRGAMAGPRVNGVLFSAALLLRRQAPALAE